MKISEVGAMVAELRRVEAGGNSQAAAAGLQTLLVETLRAIADGTEDAPALAAAALVGVDEELGDE
jgi:hypothetical protein